MALFGKFHSPYALIPVDYAKRDALWALSSSHPESCVCDVCLHCYPGRSHYPIENTHEHRTIHDELHTSLIESGREGCRSTRPVMRGLFGWLFGRFTKRTVTALGEFDARSIIGVHNTVDPGNLTEQGSHDPTTVRRGDEQESLSGVSVVSTGDVPEIRPSTPAPRHSGNGLPGGASRRNQHSPNSVLCKSDGSGGDSSRSRIPWPTGDSGGARRRRRVFAAQVARIAVARHKSRPEMSKANWLVMSRLCTDIMEAMDVRQSHIPFHLPMATSLCFVPSYADQEAAAFMASDAVEQQFVGMRVVRRSKVQGWWDLLARISTCVVPWAACGGYDDPRPFVH
jgi:hypothetical protein